MQFFFKGIANKEFKKLSFSVRVRILEKLQFYSIQQNPLEFAESLKSSEYGNWRFRIGDYRVIFDLEDDKIIILKIGHRKNIYK